MYKIKGPKVCIELDKKFMVINFFSEKPKKFLSSFYFAKIVII